MKIVNGEPYMSKDEAIKRLVATTDELTRTRNQLRQAQEDCIQIAQYTAHLENQMAAIKRDAETCMPGIIHHVFTPPNVKAALGRIAKAAAPVKSNAELCGESASPQK